MERYYHYLDIATALEVPNLDYLKRLRRFLERRRDFFRLTTEQWLNTPPSQLVTITAPSNVDVLIEGERVRSGYQGWYFPDLELTAEIREQNRKDFSEWRINGRLVTGTVLKFKADRPTSIDAVFTLGERPRSDPPKESSAAQPSIAPARLVWRVIPAGTSWMGCVPD